MIPGNYCAYIHRRPSASGMNRRPHKCNKHRKLSVHPDDKASWLLPQARDQDCSERRKKVRVQTSQGPGESEAMAQGDSPRTAREAFLCAQK